MLLCMPRKDRSTKALRPLKLTPDIAPHATGSLLIECGNTRVLCAATLEAKVPGWMKQQGVLDSGWLTAEYAMLPYSTLERKPREIARGKPDSRCTEIQRLIGRSLRAVVDLKALNGYTLWLDCDVLQADGGTRTAAITGAYVAAKIAVNRLLTEGKLPKNPFIDSVAAVSVGICAGEVILDLNYEEDSQAEVDLNVVMSGKGKFIEIQGTAERTPFDQSQLNAMLTLADEGIRQLSDAQTSILRQKAS